jgi:putative DNA methylase
MTTPIRRKLIEVSIPLEAINKASAREKSIRHGHPSTLHLWWARRPLAACRAVLFAQLVDDPSAWPDRFPTEAAQEIERKRLHGVIERLVPWEASNNDTILQEARHEIARSVAWGRGEAPPAADDGPATLRYLQEKAPPVYDPFSGGGSIPLEAQRLGLRAYGSDLNPVAVLIGKALVEIPPKFAGRPPVNPEAQARLAQPGASWTGRGAQGLAEDVRYYGRWMRDEAERRIGYLYPKATLPDGSKATVIAWLWARTVRSPDPATKGAMVPLVSSFMLSTKERTKTWVQPVVDEAALDGWRFEVRTGLLSSFDEERMKVGTKAGKGQAFVCALSGSAIDRSYIQAEGKADRLGVRLMAIVAEGSRNRIYLPPVEEHELASQAAQALPEVEDARTGFLSPLTPTRAMITGGVCSAYGLRTWGHLFTPRQIVALTNLSAIIRIVRGRVLSDAGILASCDDKRPLSSSGLGTNAYADAIVTYLAFAISRSADRGSSVCSWDSSPKMEALRNTFARQALPMTWDFAEGNPFSSSSGNFLFNVDWSADALARVPAASAGGISAIDAAKNSFPVRPVVISTDPPYYDNISYGDLSDFFYVWLRQSLFEVWPDLFRRLTTPKGDDLVATPYRFPDGDIPSWVGGIANLSSAWPRMNSKERADAFFMQGMSQALGAMRNAATEGDPLTIYYAFKQSEVGHEGVTSPGWASFLEAVVGAGLGVDGTWPIRTELSNRMIGRDANALASSIVLVCRKRPVAAPTTTRPAFMRALRRELPDAVATIRRAGVGPVDMQQSVIGPGMGVFTRHAAVLEDDDSRMTVRTALSLINRAWDEIENEATEALDAPTQVAVAWFASFGMEARPAGDLITLANAKNVATQALFDGRIFHDGRGRAALLPRDALPAEWSPTYETATAWCCLQHAIRVLNAPNGGAEAASRVIAAMGPLAEPALGLAHRLFQIATERGLSQWPHGGYDA